jgi:hypothetical protein
MVVDGNERELQTEQYEHDPQRPLSDRRDPPRDQPLRLILHPLLHGN